MSAISISYQANAALQPLAAERGQAGQLHGLAALHLIALSRQHLAASVQWQQQYECFWLQQASSNDQPDLSAAAQLLRHGCLCQYLIVITVCSWTAGWTVQSVKDQIQNWIAAAAAAAAAAVAAAAAMFECQSGMSPCCNAGHQTQPDWGRGYFQVLMRAALL